MHVNDVATLVKKVISNKPTRQYILAVDKTNFNPNKGKENSKLLNLILSISKNVGSGKIVSVPEETVVNDVRLQ